MPYMKGNRADVVKTLTGHTIRFNAADDIRFVPENGTVVNACLSHGHVIVPKPEPQPEPESEPAGEPEPPKAPRASKLKATKPQIELSVPDKE